MWHCEHDGRTCGSRLLLVMLYLNDVQEGGETEFLYQSLRIKPKKGTIVIEVQYLMNTLKDLTFDNIYHEHYNYWSLTSLTYFFNQFGAKIFKSEKIDTHGGSIRIYVKKDKSIKIDSSVKKMLKEEEDFGITRFTTYQKFGEKVYKIRENVLENIKELKKIIKQ